MRDRPEDWLGAEPETAAERYGQYLKSGCDHSMPKRCTTLKRRAAYWWNDDIAEKRKLCMAVRRRYLRAGRADASRRDEREIYNNAKKLLKIAIQASQEQAWKELVDKVEGDMWGMPY